MGKSRSHIPDSLIFPQKGEPGRQMEHKIQTLEVAKNPDRVEVQSATVYGKCGASLEDVKPVKAVG
jgi:hypothetical protein